MTAKNQPSDFLQDAIDTVGQRGTDNGYDKGQERSAAQVAAVFNALTGKALTEEDVWKVLICLKLVRNQRRPRRDNIVDLAGYVGLLGECLNFAEDVSVDKTGHLHTGPVAEITGQAFKTKLPPLSLARGYELDLWGEVLGLTRNYVAKEPNGGWGMTEAAPEADDSYRKRLQIRHNETFY